MAQLKAAQDHWRKYYKTVFKSNLSNKAIITTFEKRYLPEWESKGSARTSNPPYIPCGSTAALCHCKQECQVPHRWILELRKVFDCCEGTRERRDFLKRYIRCVKREIQTRRKKHQVEYFIPNYRYLLATSP